MNTQKSISCELFPPKTEKGFANQQATILELNRLGPEYFSVTYGAGGSTQDNTFASVDWLTQQGIEAAPHLSCIGAEREELVSILERYRDQGIRRIIALRGDLPSGAGAGGLGELLHANELVALIRERFGDHFRVEVAAYPEVHPQAAGFRKDLEHFKHKVDAGADGAITQYFYNVDAYVQFVAACRAAGVGISIVPGIMPITNYTNLVRFSDACGAEIPRWLRKRLEAFADDIDGLRAFGVDVVSRLCADLLDAGAPGLHFYTMNQAGPTGQILHNLGYRAAD